MTCEYVRTHYGVPAEIVIRVADLYDNFAHYLRTHA